MLFLGNMFVHPCLSWWVAKKSSWISHTTAILFSLREIAFDASDRGVGVVLHMAEVVCGSRRIGTKSIEETVLNKIQKGKFKKQNSRLFCISL
jgi:hypothetical protein